MCVHRIGVLVYIFYIVYMAYPDAFRTFRERWNASFVTSSVQFGHSVMSDSLQPYGLQLARLPAHHQLPELNQTHVHWVSDAIQPSHPLSSPSPPAFILLLPSIFPSIRVFSSESVLRISWPEYWSFSFGINPSDEYSGLISFKTDYFDLFAVQGTLKSLLQKLDASSKTSILQHLAFFTVQLSYPYVTTEKTTALIRRTSLIFLANG